MCHVMTANARTDYLNGLTKKDKTVNLIILYIKKPVNLLCE